MVIGLPEADQAPILAMPWSDDGDEVFPDPDTEPALARAWMNITGAPFFNTNPGPHTCCYAARLPSETSATIRARCERILVERIAKATGSAS